MSEYQYFWERTRQFGYCLEYSTFFSLCFFQTWDQFRRALELLHESYSQDWGGEEQEQEQVKRRWWLLNSQQKTPSNSWSTPLPDSPILLAVLLSTALLVLQLLCGPGVTPPLQNHEMCGITTSGQVTTIDSVEFEFV